MIEFRNAIGKALEDELADDDEVIFFGEDVARPGGVFKATPGLFEKFGEERVFDTPISELALAGAAYGAAIGGLRPVIEIMFGDFMALPMDSLVNQASKYEFLSNGTGTCPLVVRGTVGAGGRFGAIHSQIYGPWFQAVPGLIIACPSSPQDAYSLLRAAIRDDGPVLFMEHKLLYPVKAEVDFDAGPERLGTAKVVREGTDVTVVATMQNVPQAVAAAEMLAAEGIEVEVIDLRCLRPLDTDLVQGSVAKTNRLLAIEEGVLVGGWAANLVGIVAGEALEELDAVGVLTCPDAPIPFSPSLEDAYLPNAERIAGRIRAQLGLTATTS
ncbi:MAG: alpha-ketoacid dehydrogenase subunit beta [Thermoleophilia bacterium]|nr:alpha-ketoacid dehydrogenase subunit beta [Thermoleophilia bacterium]